MLAGTIAGADDARRDPGADATRSPHTLRIFPSHTLWTSWQDHLSHFSRCLGSLDDLAGSLPHSLDVLFSHTLWMCWQELLQALLTRVEALAPSMRPICTRCCFTMTNMSQACSNFLQARAFIIKLEFPNQSRTPTRARALGDDASAAARHCNSRVLEYC